MKEKHDASIYAENMSVINKNTLAEVVEDFTKHANPTELSKLMESKETLYHICRIVKIINLEQDKKYRDFFVDLKTMIEAIKNIKTVQKKVKGKNSFV